MDENSIIFLQNKYTKWYNNIITNANTRSITGYIERHHIIPKSLGGNNTKDNLVRLTAREHFVCHLLLTKMTYGYNKVKMLHALGKFVQTNHLQDRNINARRYDIARKAIIEARTGTKRPGVGGVKKGNIPWNKGIKQGPHSEESNRNRSATLTGRKRTDEFCQRVSKGKKGHKSGMTGKKHSEETKIKMSSPRGKQGPQRRTDNCPYCSDLMVTSKHIKFCKIKAKKLEWMKIK